MKNLIRLTAVVLAIIVTFGFTTIGVFAAGSPNGNEYMQVVVKTDVGTANPGDYITVTLNITNNYYATAMRFPVLFSADIFEIVEANLNLQKLGQLTIVTGNLSANITGNPAFYPAGYSSADYGVVLVQWTGTANAGMLGCYNQPDGQDAISFSLRVKAGAIGEGTILIPPESDLFYRQAMNDPADGNTTYSMTAAACPLTFTPASFTAQAPAADIAVFSGSTTVIDRDRNFIYGLSVGLTTLESSIVSVGGAELEVIKSSGDVCGTGTVVNVKHNGTVVKTFKVVIFGDVTGDGNIDSSDAGTIVDFENYLFAWDLVEDACYRAAGDVTGDGNIDGSDAGSIIDLENYLINIDQTTGLAG